MLILWTLQYMSAKMFANKFKFDADIEFSKHEIKILHRNKDEVEIKDWTWIKNINQSKTHFWLTINQMQPLIVSLSKEKMNPSEIEFFNSISKRK